MAKSPLDADRSDSPPAATATGFMNVTQLSWLCASCSRFILSCLCLSALCLSARRRLDTAAQGMVGTASDPCFREAGRTCCLGTATQVEPPGQREAGGIEREIDHQCELRAAGDRDRL